MVLETRPPQVLPVEEYRRDWQPQGWKLLHIGPTTTWREVWGEWEAIRDLVQNSLDEAEDYSWGYDERGMWIIDKGKGVAVDDWLLGPPKVKPDYARGKFGEGMKIAALALLRMGYAVHVRTVGRELWLIFTEQSTNGKRETMAALWRPNGIRKGTEFHIIGYRGPSYEKRFTVNLPKQAILAQGPSPIIEPKLRYNQLINEAYTDGPKIYARDIFLQHIRSSFSYNLWGFEMAPDRHGPKSETEMWTDMGRLWCCVNNVSLLQLLLQMIRFPPVVETEESISLSMGSLSMGAEPTSGKQYAEFVKENASAWREAWSGNFGENAVMRTSPRWDHLVQHLGYVSVSVLYSVQDTLSTAITTDEDLINASAERLREAEVIPDERLTSSQRAHLLLARAIVDKVTPYITKKRKVRATLAAVIPPASDRVRTAGMYGMQTQEIYIDLSTLEKGRTTVDATVHELAHHTSRAEDLMEKHSAHMTIIAGYVVQLTHAGEFDELMEEVTW